MEQVSTQPDALIVLRDAFLKNAIATVDRPFGLRETVLVSRTAGAADPVSAGPGREPAHNERPA